MILDSQLAVQPKAESGRNLAGIWPQSGRKPVESVPRLLGRIQVPGVARKQKKQHQDIQPHNTPGDTSYLGVGGFNQEGGALVDWVAEQRRRKWRWAGHADRRLCGRWSNRFFQWLPHSGERRRGWPLTRWEDRL